MAIPHVLASSFFVAFSTFDCFCVLSSYDGSQAFRSFTAEFGVENQEAEVEMSEIHMSNIQLEESQGYPRVHRACWELESLKLVVSNLRMQNC